MTSGPELEGWTPVRVDWRAGRPEVDWCFTEGVSFTDPFFDQTVERCFRHPFRLLFRRRTTIEDLGRFVAAHPGLPPRGFIFHMSRAGSTLVAQMLGAVPEHLVVSEAAPLDAVLRARRMDWLQWMVPALGQGEPGQRALFVKFDAWSVLELGLVRRAFPDVPWVFVFRDPVAVLVSHSRRRGAHMIPGVLPPALWGLTGEEAAAMEPDEYAARVLARICEAALRWENDPLAIFVDHSELPGFVTGALGEAWSLDVNEDGLAAMAVAGERDAKNPVLAFDCDQAAKQAAATPTIRAAADRWVAPAYQRLQAAARRQREVTCAG